MLNIQKPFDPKYSKSAELIAYLTNGITYKDSASGQIRVISRSESMDLLDNLLIKKKDYESAKKIHESLKKSSDLEVTRIMSKSIRVPTPTFLKTAEIGYRTNVSLADVVRKVASKWIRGRIEDFEKLSDISKERVDIIKNILTDWSIKKDSEPSWNYSLDFRYNLNIQTSEVFKVYTNIVEESFRKKCRAEGISEDAIKDFLSRIIQHDENVINEAQALLSFDKNVGKLRLDFFIYLNIGIDDLLRLNIDMVQTFGEEMVDRFSNLDPTQLLIDKCRTDEPIDWVYEIERNQQGYLDWDNESKTEDFFGKVKLFNYYPFMLYHLSGYVRVDEAGALYFEDVKADAGNEREIDNKIVELLARELEIEIPEIQKIEDELKKATTNKNLNRQAELTAKAVVYQSLQKVANWTRDILLDIPTRTEVVTFTIPEPLLRFWEALGEEKEKDLSVLVNEYAK